MESPEQIYLRVVEAGSLKVAAEQLGTDPSSISRKVAMLEARLGVKLLQRSTRRSSPTEAGQIYYEGMRRLQDEQAALEAMVAGEADTPKGLLRVTAPLDFGARFVAPVLKDMLQAFPSLNVELVLGSVFEDITAQNIDVAIRIGQLPDSSLICRRLGEIPRVLVASRAYLAQFGTPTTPKSLMDHSFVFYSHRQKQRPIAFLGPNGSESIIVSGHFTVNSVTAVKALVEEGMGMHVGPVWAFKESLRSGDLVSVLPEYKLAAFPLHALYTSTAFVPAKVRSFIDAMIKSEISKKCAL